MSDDALNLDLLRGIAFGAAGQKFAPVTPRQLLDLVMHVVQKDAAVALAKQRTEEHKAMYRDMKTECAKARRAAIDEHNARLTVVQHEDAMRAAIASPDRDAAVAILKRALTAPYPRTT